MTDVFKQIVMAVLSILYMAIFGWIIVLVNSLFKR